MNMRSNKVKETIDTLLEKGVVPVVNENDSVNDDELNLGIMMSYLLFSSYAKPNYNVLTIRA